MSISKAAEEMGALCDARAREREERMTIEQVAEWLEQMANCMPNEAWRVSGLGRLPDVDEVCRAVNDHAAEVARLKADNERLRASAREANRKAMDVLDWLSAKKDAEGYSAALRVWGAVFGEQIEGWHEGGPMRWVLLDDDEEGGPTHPRRQQG